MKNIMRSFHIFQASTQPKSALGPDLPLPFSGLGFDLEALVSRPPRVRCCQVQDCAVLSQDQNLPVFAGRVLLARLNREIRGS